LYWKLYQVQQKLVELRVIDGDHEWIVFRDALPDSVQFIDRQGIYPTYLGEIINFEQS